jgi:hypothetical protein
MVQFLLGEKSGVHLVFMPGAEKCLETNSPHPKNLHRKLVLKNMSMVWEKINPTFRQLDQFNTLLVDDCPYKCIGNVPFSYILPHPFDS